MRIFNLIFGDKNTGPPNPIPKCKPRGYPEAPLPLPLPESIIERECEALRRVGQLSSMTFDFSDIFQPTPEEKLIQEYKKAAFYG